MEIKDAITRLRRAITAISTATGYSRGNYLYHGNSADSSQDASYRMEFVSRAEREFIQDNQGEILARAADLARNDLKEAVQEIISSI